MKPASAKKYEALDRVSRGVRLCTRCKEEFPYSKENRICEKCKHKCSSCFVVLTDNNTYVSGTKHRKSYLCKDCTSKKVSLTRDKEKQKEYDLQRNYGISYVEYLEMLEQQGGVCAICKQPPKKLALSVDHKHEKHEKKRSPESKRYSVRGLLCWNCNAAIGKFKDDPVLMENAASYIRAGFKFKKEEL